MFERFTDRARKVMAMANQEAIKLNGGYIGTEHVLIGLMEEGTGVAATALKNLDASPHKIRAEVKKLVKKPETSPATTDKPSYSPGTAKVIEYAIAASRNMGDNYVGTEHLLLGLLREREGGASTVLANLGLKPNDVQEEVMDLLDIKPEKAPWPITTRTVFQIMDKRTDEEIVYLTVRDTEGTVSTLPIPIAVITLPDDITGKNLVITRAGKYTTPTIEDPARPNK